MNRVLDLHLEYARPEKFPSRKTDTYFEEILEKDIPIILDVAPWQRIVWSEQVFEIAKEVVSRENSYLGQQGELHMCPFRHKYLDFNHENRCTVPFRRIPVKSQMEFMKRGKDELFDLFGEEPIVYSPPNHQKDEATFKAAENLGYKYVTDNSILPMKPYIRSNLIVLPEGSIEKNKIEGREVVYVHYDRIKENRATYDKVLNEGIVSLDEVETGEVSDWDKFRNEQMIMARKGYRDVRNFFKGKRFDSEKTRRMRSELRDR